MTRKTTTITKREEGMDENDNPAVLAYRVGQNERGLNTALKQQAEGFARLDVKLDVLASGFVTGTELKSVQDRADVKHAAQDEKIKALEGWNTWAARIVFSLLIASIVTTLALKSNGVV